MISEGSCDTEDWSNVAENSALITGINYIILNCNNILQYYCFYCIFNQINAAIKVLQNGCLYCKNVVKNSQLQYLYSCFIIFTVEFIYTVCIYLYIYIYIYMHLHTSNRSLHRLCCSVCKYFFLVFLVFFFFFLAMDTSVYKWFIISIPVFLPPHGQHTSILTCAHSH